MQVERDARLLDSAQVVALDPQLRAAEQALELPALNNVAASLPDQFDLVTLQRAGRPWCTIASLAEQFQKAENDPQFFISKLIAPDPKVAGSLFHLAVVGEILLELPLNSIRPLGIPSDAPGAIDRGPHFRKYDNCRDRSLWIEAGGIWAYKDAASPYLSALSGLPHAGRKPLSPDILLLDGERALILECKYSPDPAVIAAGYSQVITYASELRRLFADITTAVVGPSGVVMRRGEAETHAGRVLVIPAAEVRALIAEWLAEAGTPRGQLIASN
jgi:hypothetical protein